MYRIGEKPEVGGIAPDFELRDFNGDNVRLSNFKGRVNVVLAFYRGEADPYSMRWLSHLNDDYLYFRSLDTDILAISPDSVDKARHTVSHYKIPFKLLSDPRMSAIKEYGVYDTQDNGADAAIFIIDRSGIVRYKRIGKAPEDIPPNEKLMETIRHIA